MKKHIIQCILLLLVVSCKSSVNIYNSSLIDDTHIIINNDFKKAIDFFLDENTESFEYWRSTDKKIIYVNIKKNDTVYDSNFTPLIRRGNLTPRNLLNNNYYGYLIYKSILIVVWGDGKPFLQRINSVKKKKLFNYKRAKSNNNKEDKIEDNFYVDEKSRYYEFYSCHFRFYKKNVVLLQKSFQTSLEVLEGFPLDSIPVQPPFLSPRSR